MVTSVGEREFKMWCIVYIWVRLWMKSIQDFLFICIKHFMTFKKTLPKSFSTVLYLHLIGQNLVKWLLGYKGKNSLYSDWNNPTPTGNLEIPLLRKKGKPVVTMKFIFQTETLLSCKRAPLIIILGQYI